MPEQLLVQDDEQLLVYDNEKISWTSDYRYSTNQESARAFETMGADDLASQEPEGTPPHLAAASGDDPGEDFSELDHGFIYPAPCELEGGGECTNMSLDDEDIGFVNVGMANANLTAADNSYVAQQDSAFDYASPAVDTRNWQPSNQGVVPRPVGNISHHGNPAYYKQQNGPAAAGTHRTASGCETQYECRLPIRQWASDSTSSDHSQWFGAHMVHDAAGASQMHVPSIFEHDGDVSSHSQPWNPLVLRGPQVFPTTPPFHGNAAISSQSPSENYNLVSPLSSNMPSKATSSSRRRDLLDSMMDIGPQLTPNNLTRVGCGSHGCSSNNLPPGGQHRDTAGVSAGSDRRGPCRPGAGESSRYQDPRIVVLKNTETSSSVGLPGQIIDSSEVLLCPYVGCPKKFKGKCRRGTRSRHIRLKHAHGQEEMAYHCEVLGCSKVYCRQDARLKHYRKRHSDVISVAAAKARK